MKKFQEELVDLHVAVVLPKHWKRELNYASQKVLDERISAGFIRVHPQSTIFSLRDEISKQIGLEKVYPHYLFLRHVGKCLVLVHRNQEDILKSLDFMPPRIEYPELLILPGPEAILQSYSIAAKSVTYDLAAATTSDGNSSIGTHNTNHDGELNGDYDIETTVTPQSSSFYEEPKGAQSTTSRRSLISQKFQNHGYVKKSEADGGFGDHKESNSTRVFIDSTSRSVRQAETQKPKGNDAKISSELSFTKRFPAKTSNANTPTDYGQIDEPYARDTRGRQGSGASFNRAIYNDRRSDTSTASSNSGENFNVDPGNRKSQTKRTGYFIGSATKAEMSPSVIEAVKTASFEEHNSEENKSFNGMIEIKTTPIFGNKTPENVKIQQSKKDNPDNDRGKLQRSITRKSTANQENESERNQNDDHLSDELRVSSTYSDGEVIPDPVMTLLTGSHTQETDKSIPLHVNSVGITKAVELILHSDDILHPTSFQGLHARLGSDDTDDSETDPDRSTRSSLSIGRGHDSIGHNSGTTLTQNDKYSVHSHRNVSSGIGSQQGYYQQREQVARTPNFRTRNEVEHSNNDTSLMPNFSDPAEDNATVLETERLKFRIKNSSTETGIDPVTASDDPIASGHVNGLIAFSPRPVISNSSTPSHSDSWKGDRPLSIFSNEEESVRGSDFLNLDQSPTRFAGEQRAAAQRLAANGVPPLSTSQFLRTDKTLISRPQALSRGTPDGTHISKLPQSEREFQSRPTSPSSEKTMDNTSQREEGNVHMYVTEKFQSPTANERRRIAHKKHEYYAMSPYADSAEIFASGKSERSRAPSRESKRNSSNQLPDKSSHEDENIRNAMWEELQKAREKRERLEQIRQVAIKQARSKAAVIARKRDGAQDIWKRRYHEEKKNTGSLTKFYRALQKQYTRYTYEHLSYFA